VYVLVMFLFLAVPIAVIVVVVSLAARSHGPTRAPLFSPDGHWWWDGRQWQPVPKQGGPPNQPATGS
jgi:ABC-type spermidine/putrescine transport system permease subunit II